MKREDFERHVTEAAGSHFKLQSGEIQRLRRIIREKVTNIMSFFSLRTIICTQYYCVLQKSNHVHRHERQTVI